MRKASDMKQITTTKYFMLPDGSVVRPLKPRVKGSVRYYNLCIDGRLKAFSEKTIRELYNAPRS
jgi:hypothetical protein